MRLVAIVQLLALIVSVLVDPVAHAVGFTVNHSHENYAAHLVDSYAHAEAVADHSHDQDSHHYDQNTHDQDPEHPPVPLGDNHQPGHCHLAFFITSPAQRLDMPVTHQAFRVIQLTRPLDWTYAPPTRPPLAA